MTDILTRPNVPHHSPSWLPTKLLLQGLEIKPQLSWLNQTLI